MNITNARTRIFNFDFAARHRHGSLYVMVQLNNMDVDCLHKLFQKMLTHELKKRIYFLGAQTAGVELQRRWVIDEGKREEFATDSCCFMHNDPSLELTFNK